MLYISSLRRIVPVAAALVLLSFVMGARTQQASTKATVITVERLNGRVTYKVDSQRVGELLSALNKVVDREGPSRPVTVLIDPTLPISEIWNIDGVAGKAQLTNVRFFAVFRETEMMSEIRRMPAIRLGAPIE